jgi:hypothetical protein
MASEGDPSLPSTFLDLKSLCRQGWATKHPGDPSRARLYARPKVSKGWDPGPSKEPNDTTQYHKPCSKGDRGVGGVARTVSVKHEWKTHTLGVRRSVTTIRYVETIRHMSLPQTDRLHNTTNSEAALAHSLTGRWRIRKGQNQGQVGGKYGRHRAADS